MDSNLTAALIGAVAGVVVWLFSWLWILWTERRARGRIQTLIRIEIEGNLAALREFRASVEKQVTFWNAKHMVGAQRGDALSSIPLPTFSQRIWESLTPSLPVGLTVDEIRAVYRFYSDLEELKRLKSISRDPQSEWKDEIERIMNGLLEKAHLLSDRALVKEMNDALSKSALSDKSSKPTPR